MADKAERFLYECQHCGTVKAASKPYQKGQHMHCAACHHSSQPLALALFVQEPGTTASQLSFFFASEIT